MIIHLNKALDIARGRKHEDAFKNTREQAFNDGIETALEIIEKELLQVPEQEFITQEEFRKEIIALARFYEKQ